MTRREELRQDYLPGLCVTIRAYVLAGHEVHVRTEHGRTPRDNQIVFEIPDWDAFAEFMEHTPAAFG